MVVAALIATGCGQRPPAVAADTIYVGGSIITINDAAPSAEAVAIKDGRILAVGVRADIERAHKGASTATIDLAGHTLIPGFVDAHGHFGGVGLQAISANLLPPPDGPGSSIPELQKTLRAFIATSATVKQYGVVIGFNYDDSQLAEHRHPTRQELDAVDATMPIVIVHQSGHLAVLNSVALARAGITAASQDPPGGMIWREAGSRTPSGVLAENAMFANIFSILPKFTPEQAVEQLVASQDIYLANGYTTIQDGRTDPGGLAVLQLAAKAGRFKADVVSYPDLVMNEKAPVLSGPLMTRTYVNHLRLGGVKLTFDGSPQGKTAWFTQPYFKAPQGEKPDYRGYPSITSEAEVVKWVTLAYQHNWQLLVHANGDAAIDQLITSVRAAAAAVPGSDRRTVLIHGQYLRKDQVAPLKQLGIFPAVFPMHTFYWGDWHRESVAGPERAANTSPTGWLLAEGMKFSIHHDAPVTFPNSMRILDSAVNRTTRTKFVLGPEHRLDPIVALKAMTIWPAYQHFEEATRGTIEVGKVADFVVLSGNPLTVARSALIDLKVLETIKAGKTVFAAK
jgi:hypothetical protein